MTHIDNRYRVGHHQPINLYRGDDYIGVCAAAEDAAVIVAVLNGEQATPRPGPYHAHRNGDLYRGADRIAWLFHPADAAFTAEMLNTATTVRGQQ